MNMSLYQLTGERLELANKLAEMELDQLTIADTLEANSEGLVAKFEDYGFVLRNRYSLVEAMDAEIDRMKQRRDAENKRVEAIEKRLLDSMVACGFTKVECPAFTLSVRKNNPKVIIDDEKLIPYEYMIHHVAPPPPPPSPDKKAISAAIKSGLIVEGCHAEQGMRLEIK